MRLRDLDPEKLADDAQAALLGQLWRPAMMAGVTEPLAPSIAPSDAWLAVQQLALYATTGTPPEGRLELVHEYQISVAEVQCYLEAGSEEHETLELILQASAAREALGRGDTVTQRQMAALASLDERSYRRLVESGDAPRGVVESRHEGARIPAEEAIRWLGSRGVNVGAEAASALTRLSQELGEYD